MELALEHTLLRRPRSRKGPRRGTPVCPLSVCIAASPTPVREEVLTIPRKIRRRDGSFVHRSRGVPLAVEHSDHRKCSMRPTAEAYNAQWRLKGRILAASWRSNHLRISNRSWSQKNSRTTPTTLNSHPGGALQSPSRNPLEEAHPIRPRVVTDFVPVETRLYELLTHGPSFMKPGNMHSWSVELQRRSLADP